MHTGTCIAGTEGSIAGIVRGSSGSLSHRLQRLLVPFAVDTSLAADQEVPDHSLALKILRLFLFVAVVAEFFAVFLFI